MKSIAFIDTEVSTEDNKSYDFGAIDNSGKQLHTGVPHEFFSFIENKDFICGHNIVDHDAKHTVISNSKETVGSAVVKRIHLGITHLSSDYSSPSVDSLRIDVKKPNAP